MLRSFDYCVCFVFMKKRGLSGGFQMVDVLVWLCWCVCDYVVSVCIVVCVCVFVCVDMHMCCVVACVSVL